MAGLLNSNRIIKYPLDIILVSTRLIKLDWEMVFWHSGKQLELTCMVAALGSPSERRLCYKSRQQFHPNGFTMCYLHDLHQIWFF